MRKKNEFFLIILLCLWLISSGVNAWGLQKDRRGNAHTIINNNVHDVVLGSGSLKIVSTQNCALNDL